MTGRKAYSMKRETKPKARSQNCNERPLQHQGKIRSCEKKQHTATRVPTLVIMALRMLSVVGQERSRESIESEGSQKNNHETARI